MPQGRKDTGAMEIRIVNNPNTYYEHLLEKAQEEYRKFKNGEKVELFSSKVTLLNNLVMNPNTDSNDNNLEGLAFCRELEVKRDKQIQGYLDAQLQMLKSLIRSGERSLSITKLQEAIMWLDMDLKRLNE